MEQTVPKKNPETASQPPLLPTESEAPPFDPETLRRQAEENQEELKKEREAKAERRGHYTDH